MDLSTLLKKLKPILGEKETRRAWEQLQLADPKTTKLLEFSLRRRLAEATGTSFEEREILLEPIPAHKAAGEVRLGTVCYGRQSLHSFALRPGELIQHLAIFGRSGAGKTNVAFLLLRELSRLRIPFLVFDWKKNYRDLIRLPSFHDLVVYTVGRDEAPFFFNPLSPPNGVAPREWLKKLIEIMQHAYFLGEGVAFVLQEALDKLYREFGIYEDSGHWPTLRDLLTSLRARKVKGREASWMESVLRAVGVLCFGAMDWVLNSGARVAMEEVLGQKAVLELDALTNSDKTFLIETLLLWIHHHRMTEPGRERLKHVLLIEEAHHVLLKKKQELTGAEAVTDVILREVREFGQAIVLLDQLPSLISRPALENTYTTIAMNLKEKGDVTAAAKAMLLESDEARYLGRLPVGSAIVKLQARWVKPFLVRFPLFPIRKGVVTDQQVRDRFQESLSPEETARMMKATTDAMVRLAQGVIAKGERAAGRGQLRGEEASRETVSEGELEFLRDVDEHPVSPVTERYARVGLSPKQGTSLVSQLINRELLSAATIPIPGSHVKLLDLTPEGRRQTGFPEPPDRHGGPEHRYWVETIAHDLDKAGVQIQKEAPLGEGKTVDILVTRGDKRIGIEVETGKSDWKANARKCLDAGLDEVILAGTRASVCRGIERNLSAALRRTVQVTPPQEVHLAVAGNSIR
jgi:hypothetical protein